MFFNIFLLNTVAITNFSTFISRPYMNVILGWPIQPGSTIGLHLTFWASHPLQMYSIRIWKGFSCWLCILISSKSSVDAGIFFWSDLCESSLPSLLVIPLWFVVHLEPLRAHLHQVAPFLWYVLHGPRTSLVSSSAFECGVTCCGAVYCWWLGPLVCGLFQWLLLAILECILPSPWNPIRRLTFLSQRDDSSILLYSGIKRHMPLISKNWYNIDGTDDTNPILGVVIASDFGFLVDVEMGQNGLWSEHLFCFLKCCFVNWSPNPYRFVGS